MQSTPIGLHVTYCFGFDASYSTLSKNGATNTSSSELVFGNPYLGIEVGQVGNPGWGELGVRIPLAPSSKIATYTGFFADYDRCEAFMTDNLSITAMGKSCTCSLRQSLP